MAYWSPISGIKPPIPIREFAGVYNPDDQGFNLPDNVFTELTNFCPDEYPSITTRPGYTVVGTFGTGVLGIGVWKETEVHVIFNNGTWQRLNANGTWTVLASGLSTTAKASFANFKGNLSGINLMMANGVDPVKRYDGSTVQNLTNAPASSSYIEQHDNRVYVVNGNIVSFCALNKPTDFNTVDDAGQIGVESSDGETISAVKSGPKHLVIFKPNSMYDLLGTGPTSFTLIPVAADIGAINNNCTVNIGGYIYFLHTTGVYTYASARPKKDFCKPIMGFIKRINQSALSQCSVGTDGLNLYVSLPLDSSTVPNIILQYNLESGAWYTWSDYSAVNFAFMNNKNYIGNADGSVRRVEGTTNNGDTIVQTLVTKPFTAESISKKTQWLKIWVVASLEAGSTLEVYISGQASGEEWKLSKTLSAATGIQYREILVQTSSVASANAVRLKFIATGVVSIHEITRVVRELPMRR